MARSPPIELLASKMREVYRRKKEMIREGAIITDRGIRALKMQEQKRMMLAWKERLRDVLRRHGSFRKELMICFEDWMTREHGELTFWMTQMITTYTNRIEKSNTARCSFCEAIREDNHHVLVECVEWNKHRGRLEETLGCQVYSLTRVMKIIAVNKDGWNAFAEFCRVVMERKEVREREEQDRERWRGGLYEMDMAMKE